MREDIPKEYGVTWGVLFQNCTKTSIIVGTWDLGEHQLKRKFDCYSGGLKITYNIVGMSFKPGNINLPKRKKMGSKVSC